MTKIYLLTYNFGNVKAGPVIRFMRYQSYFIKKGYELIFLTKKRNTTIDKLNYKVVYFDCKENYHSFFKKATKYILSASEDVKCIITFQMSYKNFSDFSLLKKNGYKIIFVSTMKLNLNSYNLFSKLILKILLKRLYSFSDYIVSSSSLLNHDMKSLGISEKKLKIINNGVDTKRFSPITTNQKKILKKKYGIKLNTKMFLYVGLFISRKQVIRLIKTFEKLKNKKNIVLVLVGKFMSHPENSTDFENNWKKVVKKHSNSKWLNIYPFSEKIEDFYKMADFFTFYSKLEGMPNVLLEAMASGNCIISNKFDGFSDDYGIENTDYIFFKNNFEKDVDTIQKLINDEERTKAFSINSRKNALNKFSIQSSINDYIQLFD